MEGSKTRPKKKENKLQMCLRQNKQTNKQIRGSKKTQKEQINLNGVSFKEGPCEYPAYLLT